MASMLRIKKRLFPAVFLPHRPMPSIFKRRESLIWRYVFSELFIMDIPLTFQCFFMVARVHRTLLYAMSEARLISSCNGYRQIACQADFNAASDSPAACEIF
jgi:hypothetical protein